ncbi:MAG TPA: ATP-dependent Clp protease ATP-binding subunit [Kofleriaceae bacterium]|jgi:ATP-dependent Clp protease ATP-binding subunit ClpC|nr:ATP-dependent Clp protease ATP-binding subunit [Kofleriaceae bacterium]
MFGLSDPIAGHVRAAEALARAARLDVVEVAHVVAAMCQRPSWLRSQLADAADVAAREILDQLGRGDGGIPAWSTQLRKVFERARGKAGIVDEPRLLAAIAEVPDAIIAGVLEGVGPLPYATLAPLEEDEDDRDGDDVVGAPMVAPPVEVEVASIRIGPSTPTLDAFGRDLVAEAGRGRVRPAFGREDVFDRIIVTLARHTKPHLILVGEAGVGKTAIAEGLGVKLANGEIPELATMRIVAVSPAALVAGASHRGEIENRVRRMIAEATASRTLVFLDEIHGLLSTGSPGMTAADVLKPALANGTVRVIGATTPAEYERYIARDAALARRFERIDVLEPDAAATLAMLRGLCPTLERHHSIAIDDAAIAAAIELTTRYLPSRRQPDKAIDVLDEACARVRRDGKPRVTAVEVGAAAALRAGVALSELGTEQRAELANLEARITARVIGQQAAIDGLCRCVVRSRLGFKPAGKPVGAILLSGPSGVGKTALAHALSEEAFGAGSLLRIDLAEFSEGHQVARLIGAPPGYIGHDGDGVLTSWLRTRPHSVVLLDEIDKAHPRVRELLLGLFDAGRVADARGMQVTGEHALFIATAVSSSGDPRTLLGAELVGRLDAIIAMRRLGPAEYKQIAGLLVDEARARLAGARVTLEVDDAVLDILARAGGRDASDGPDLGARPIRGAIERTLIDPIASMLLGRSPPLAVRATARNGMIQLVL